MNRRVIVVLLGFVVPLDAHADPSTRSILFKPVPPLPADRRPSTFAASVERFFLSSRNAAFAVRERGAESIGRDAATSLGVRQRSLSLPGASLAAIGAGAWAVSRGGRSNATITVGPRLYGGGGGLGVVFRW